MGVIQQVVGLADRAVRQVGCFQRGAQVGGVPGFQYLGHARHQPGARGFAVDRRGQARVGGPFGWQEFLREVAPLRVTHHRHEHAAIGGFEHVVHAPGRLALGAHGLGRGAGQLELRDELRDQQKIVFEQAGPHMAAAPRGVAVVQCGQGAHHAERAAQDVVDRRGHALRRVGAAVDIGQAAHHLHHFIQRRPVLVRPRQKALERHVDQPGVFGRQRFIVQPVLRQAAVAEVLHHHVGLQR
ncbi:hypothetical protein D3C73_1137610 [compost metagenome]